MENTKPKLAIIGCGLSGFLSAKYAKAEGYEVMIFEKRSSLGGLWSESGAMWTGMRTNASKYTNQFTDFLWSDFASIFPSPKEVLDYFQRYVEHFQLAELIKFNTEVINVSYANKEKTQFIFTYRKVPSSSDVDISNSEVVEEMFDKVIVASGYFTKPAFGEFEKFKNNPSNDKIQITHTYYYKDPYHYKDKTVIVVGCSFSSCEVSSEVGHCAKKTINLFNKPYHVFQKTEYNPLYKKKLPLDFMIFTRNSAIRKEESFQTPTNLRNKATNGKMVSITGQNDLCKDLYIDPESEEYPFFSCSAEYRDCVRKGLVEAKRGNIVNIENNIVYLNTGEEIAADVVILGTGFNNSLYFLNDEIRNELEYSEKDDFIPLLLYNHTFNPKIKNLAFVGYFRGLLFLSAEIQAIYALKYLENKLVYPLDEEKVEKYFETDRELRKLTKKPQYARSNYVELCDILAKEIGILPNFEQIQKEDPELHDHLMAGPLLGVHYLLENSSPTIREEVVAYIKRVNFDLRRKNTTLGGNKGPTSF
jgi:dimethylaniline monooxygenase (N-oxide forming)